MLLWSCMDLLKLGTWFNLKNMRGEGGWSECSRAMGSQENFRASTVGACELGREGNWKGGKSALPFYLGPVGMERFAVAFTCFLLRPGVMSLAIAAPSSTWETEVTEQPRDCTPRISAC
jgi:hypothetical protein